MKAEEILKLDDLQTRVASAIEYNYVEKGDVLMVNNKGEFAKVEADRVSGRKFQGWVECMCAENLESAIGLGDTSEDGLAEADKIINWMREQR